MAIVYILRNPMKIDASGRNKIFYVGMSFNDDVNDRPRAHIKESYSDDSYNPHKSRTIKQILNAGLEVDIEILYVGIDKELASELEVFLISFLGRRCAEKWGILCNIGKGGEGNTSDRTPEDIERLKQQTVNYWNSVDQDTKDARGKLLVAGLRNKLANDNNFKIEYSKTISKAVMNRPNQKEIMEKLNSRERNTQADIEGRKKAAKTTKERGHTRDRCSCVLCKQEIPINALKSQHGENKCTGDKSLRKDTTGNKGNYVRTRACCIVCRMETITSKINPHYKSAHE